MMRRNGTPVMYLLAVALTACVSACASTPAPDADSAAAPAGASVVNIQNNHTSFTDATIFIVADATGARQPLGPVPPGEARTFTFDGGRGWYRLIAQRAAGDIVSERFNLPGNARVDWMTSQSRVQVRTR